MVNAYSTSTILKPKFVDGGVGVGVGVDLV